MTGFAIFRRKYATGTGADVYLPMTKRAVVDLAVGADWTPAAGDCKVSKDGGAAANIGTLPTAIAMGNGAYWKFVFTDAELTCKSLAVTVADSATKAVEDAMFVVETYGHASAQWATDQGTGVLAADAIAAASIASNAITAAKIADGAIDRATFAADTGLQTVRSNTAQSGASGSITLDASASATDDIYNDHWVYVTGGTGVGQIRLITDYVGATKVATIAPNWATNPDNTSTFAVMPSPQRLSANALDTIVVEAGVNARQALAVIGSKLAGKRSGMATSTNTYKGLDNTTSRIVETTDADGNATVVTLSLPS